MFACQHTGEKPYRSESHVILCDLVYVSKTKSIKDKFVLFFSILSSLNVIYVISKSYTEVVCPNVEGTEIRLSGSIV